MDTRILRLTLSLPYPPPYQLRPVPVLIVDEDPMIREGLRTLLSSAGCTVAEARSEMDTLQYLRGALDPHVVLLDFFLPLATRSTVLHLAHQSAALQRHCYVVVIDTDEARLPNEEQRLIRELCVEVVAKSLDAVALLQAVAQAATHLAPTP